MNEKNEQDKLVSLVLKISGVLLLVFLLFTLAKAWMMHRALNELKAAARAAIPAPVQVSLPKPSPVPLPKKTVEVEQPRLIQEADLDAEREKAWLRFYRPSSICAADPTTVACANAFIRARREFESRYKN